jgi:hypothetical protein
LTLEEIAMKKIWFLSLLFFFLTAAAFAGTVNLPRTGQTNCYDANGAYMPCAGTGEDGEIKAGVAWPNPRLTDNGDGTMTDYLTGLMWMKDANLPGGTKTWLQALDYVAGMNMGSPFGPGYTDWRLPNVNELRSLINFNEANNAAWLTSQGFTNVQDYSYWSSTSCASCGVPYDAWSVNMWSGGTGVLGYAKDYSYDHYVWPVRSGQCGSLENSLICLPQTGQTKCYDELGYEISCSGTGQDGEIQAGVAWPIPRFTDHGNDTVTDNLTGLMWTKNAYVYGAPVGWGQALSYAKKMNNGTYENFGYTDWRLPNVNELASLINFNEANNATWLTSQGFTNVQEYYSYWSSTLYAFEPDETWSINMYHSHVGTYGSYEDGYVWPVRGGQTGCSAWTDVIGKYNAYVSGSASWTDVIECYNQYVSP